MNSKHTKHVFKQKKFQSLQLTTSRRPSFVPRMTSEPEDVAVSVQVRS